MKHHIQAMIDIARETFSSSPLLDKQTGSINVKGDASIGMDVKIEELFLEYLKQQNLPVQVFSEESGIIALHDQPEYLVAFDPLDGSTNYKLSKGLLPFGVLIAIYKGINPTLDDIVAAGALEQTRNLSWFYEDGKTTDHEGNPVTLSKTWTITKSTPVYLDLYYKQGYQNYAALPEQVFIRNTGSTIGNLSLVLSTVAAAMGGVCMRSEEIGALYALIKGAGGTVCSHEGMDLGRQKFSPETTYQTLAGNSAVVQHILPLLQS